MWRQFLRKTVPGRSPISLVAIMIVAPPLLGGGNDSVNKVNIHYMGRTSLGKFTCIEFSRSQKTESVKQLTMIVVGTTACEHKQVWLTSFI